MVMRLLTGVNTHRYEKSAQVWTSLQATRQRTGVRLAMANPGAEQEGSREPQERATMRRRVLV
jgi:hypothetical protein